ncbi:B-cadherin isoform X2 [Astyanax mexicanus]|uniref:B-cadherin isoform X2 n=1 Tax=Astyanax mexicanus TaxID=7994 RepID=UPI0020CAC7C6|nr:B-cadherin isoform X2 [Astyanax mexicanus]
METLRSVRLGVLLVLLQVLSTSFADQTPCSNGFDSAVFIFKVHRPHLHRGRRLGRVIFNDCSGRTRHAYDSTDKRFQVEGDGTVKLKRQVTLHEGHKLFSVHVWDSVGSKHTTSVKVEQEARIDHHHGHHDDKEAVSTVESESPSDLPVLEFPKSSGGLRRRKREWVIPPIFFPENHRGPFPKEMVQIKSSHAKETKMVYSITGEGADKPPVGLFTINKNTGWLSVTKPLDRETKDKYVLQAHSIAADGEVKEDPMEIIVNVIDQNDNKPIFTQNPFLGSVPEASPKEFEFMIVNATDADDPETDNADVRYSIISQTPPLPDPNMFIINSITGGIRVNSDGLDRENYPEYTLLIQAADLAGNGLVSTGTAVITVTDSNDNAPKFEKTSYTASVPENKVGAVVVKLPVTDGDEPQSPAWMAKFRIISGNNGGFFAINTGPNKQEGIITTVKPLDFEQNNKYTLLVIAENEVPFANPLQTSTATVIVNVQDVNEAPVFDPVEHIISIPEDLEVGTEITVYTATDPDTARAQTVTYRISSEDRAGWVSVDRDTGLIRVKSPMDRESPFVKDGKYKVLILAVDNDQVPATGTGTLVIELEDVNDNAPVVEEREIKVCNKDSVPVSLSATDKDGPRFAAPFTVELQGDGRNNWTARMNDSNKIILTLKTALQQGKYNVVLRVYDSGLHHQDSTILASVCDCTGEDLQCLDREIAGLGLSPILGILGAILALLILVLLLLLFLRKKRSVKKHPLLPEDDVRDDLYYYDEEGGGEDDQDYDLSILHRGLDNRPGVFRNDEAPTFMAAPQYRPRPTNPEEIGTFIDDNLKAADNDPTAPPYDSLLVFDYEGGGSEAGSLSSLNSSDSGDQDYDRLHEWGPRFKKLADMYGGGDEL